MESIDILLQGIYDDYTEELISHYLQLSFVNQIVVSFGPNDMEPKGTDRVIYIRNEYPSNPGTGNRNLQLVTSINGLDAITTDYAVKIRSDQKYSLKCMEDMWKYFLDNRVCDLSFEDLDSGPHGSIITGGNFAPFPFHPRDHIFRGHINDLINLFNIPLEEKSFSEVYGLSKFYESFFYDKHIRTECYIGSHYCSKFNSRIKKFLEEPENYLHDHSQHRDEAMKLSKEITHKIFKPVPEECIEMEWPKYGWDSYRFDSQRKVFGERWAADFS